MPKHKVRHTKHKLTRRKQPTVHKLLKAQTETTKIAVVGLIGAGTIMATGAALKNLTSS